MKNSQSKLEQEQRFQRKLNHLQGFIGMPNWDLEKPPYHKLKEYEQRGRKMQAEAVHTSTKKVGKLLMKLIGIVLKSARFFLDRTSKDIVTDLKRCRGANS